MFSRQHVWGNFAAFLYIWTQVMIIFPTSNAAIGITFALYVLQPAFPDCTSPENAVRLLAAVAIGQYVAPILFSVLPLNMAVR